MSPSPERVKALKSLKAPRNTKELSSLLGLATYSARFIYNFSILVDPLRELARKSDGNKLCWNTEYHDDVLEKIKTSLSTDAIAYFNPQWDTEVICDASPVGVAAVLCQVDPFNQKNRPMRVEL